MFIYGGAAFREVIKSLNLLGLKTYIFLKNLFLQFLLRQEKRIFI